MSDKNFTIALSGYNGRFVTAEREEGRALYASALRIGGTETFEFAPVSLTTPSDPRWFTIRVKRGPYWAYWAVDESTGAVQAIGRSPGEWGIFELDLREESGTFTLKCVANRKFIVVDGPIVESPSPRDRESAEPALPPIAIGRGQLFARAERPRPESTFQRVELHRWALIAANGAWVRPEFKGRLPLFANGTDLRRSHVFDVAQAGEEYVALRSGFGGYVQAPSEGDDPLPLIADAKEITKSARFKIQWLPMAAEEEERRCVLVAANNCRVRAVSGGCRYLIADRPSAARIRPEEVFRIYRGPWIHEPVGPLEPDGPSER